jgi:hypothetical protein
MQSDSDSRLGLREVEEGVRDGLDVALLGRLQVAEELGVVRVEDVHELVGHREGAVPVVELAPVLRVAVCDLRQEALWGWRLGWVGRGWSGWSEGVFMSPSIHPSIDRSIGSCRNLHRSSVDPESSGFTHAVRTASIPACVLPPDQSW